MNNIFKNKNKNKLNFINSKSVGCYNERLKYNKLKNIKDIIKKYRLNILSSSIFIISKFNNKIYPMFDLDELKKYDNFRDNFTYKYVIFQSSPAHYWV
jgi:hypothetical protein